MVIGFESNKKLFLCALSVNAGYTLYIMRDTRIKGNFSVAGVIQGILL